jgi:diadenosine tetraphosphate (Ap4A) HIT family hydrolase
MTTDEYMDAFSLVRGVKDQLQKEFEPQGFNIGVNCGEVAGQTVFHAHVHVIPRYAGDVPNPRGGVRNVIPGKGNY